MKRLLLIPAFIGISAAIRHAFRKATDNISDEFGDDASFIPADWRHLTRHPLNIPVSVSIPAAFVPTSSAGAASAAYPGTGGNPIDDTDYCGWIDDSPAIHLDADTLDISFHSGPNTNSQERDHGRS